MTNRSEQPANPCECQCGLNASPGKRFISGHNSSVAPPHWKGGRAKYSDGYVGVALPEHPKANRGGYVAEHILKAEQALNKPLPDGAVVHHHNEDRTDNTNANLVICQNQGYHNLLHKRMRIVAFGGDPNTERICCSCRKLKPIAAFCRRVTTSDKLSPICRECDRDYKNRKKAS